MLNALTVQRVAGRSPKSGKVWILTLLMPKLLSQWINYSYVITQDWKICHALPWDSDWSVLTCDGIIELVLIVHCTVRQPARATRTWSLTDAWRMPLTARTSDSTWTQENMQKHNNKLNGNRTSAMDTGCLLYTPCFRSDFRVRGSILHSETSLLLMNFRN